MYAHVFFLNALIYYLLFFLYWCKVELPSHGQRLYIDPCNYEDPEEALKEFAKELDKKWITLEKVIGGGMSDRYIFLESAPHLKMVQAMLYYMYG